MIDGVKRLIHLVWLGSAIPSQVLRLRREILDREPQLEVRIWQDEDLTWLQNHAELRAEPRPSGKANIARYELLAVHGGLYLDADVRVHRSLEPIFESIEAHGLVVARQSPTVYNPAVIGAEPGHPALEAAVAGIPATCTRFARMSSPARTGPHYFTSVLMNHLRDGGSFYELPQHAVFPWYSDEDPLPLHLLPESVVMSHEWAAASGSWSWDGTGDTDGAGDVIIPNRRSRRSRSAGSLRAVAAATPSIHHLIARVEAHRDGGSSHNWLHEATRGLSRTPALMEASVAHLATRTLRGSACLLDLHPRSLAPAAGAARVLDRPGRVIVARSGPAELPPVLSSPAIRCSISMIGCGSESLDDVTDIASRGTPILGRVVSSAAPPVGTVDRTIGLDVASLIRSVPRFDLARARAQHLTDATCEVLREMMVQRRIGRLVLEIDPLSASQSTARAIEMVQLLSDCGHNIRIGPWLVDGRGRTWREHLRVATRPFHFIAS